MDSKNISLVIPIFNEELNIVNLFDEIISSQSYQNINTIIYVNDCSTDNSLNVLNSLKKKYDKIHIINHASNMGQSNCILSASKYSKDDLILTIDGDGQNDPLNINNLIEIYKLDSQVKLVAGIRKFRKDNLVKIFSSKLANYFRMKILKDDCVDTGCSLKLFDKRIFLSFPFFNGIHRFLPALYKGFGHNVIFAEVNHRRRKYGQSKYGTIGRLINGIKDLKKVFLIIRENNK
tara:strand:+ start:909 stop:1610 length:702 start_codon:yes stop_codon:yes gene_type:complete